MAPSAACFIPARLLKVTGKLEAMRAAAKGSKVSRLRKGDAAPSSSGDDNGPGRVVDQVAYPLRGPRIARLA